MRITVIVQARVGSNRLPAKVLLDLGGATALQRCLDRARLIDGVHEIVVATTDQPADDLIVSLARRLGVKTFRGSETDVLSRFVGAAREARSDAVVRITSDCPLLDPRISSSVVEGFVDARNDGNAVDYVSNVLERRLPRGLDTEILSMEALERANRDAVDAFEREHVTLHVYRRPATFRLRSISPTNPRDLSGLRWTLDTLDDYRFLAAVYDALGSRALTAGVDEVLEVLERHPHLAAINAHVEQKRT